MKEWIRKDGKWIIREVTDKPKQTPKTKPKQASKVKRKDRVSERFMKKLQCPVVRELKRDKARAALGLPPFHEETCD